MSSTALLDLPVELRLRIYELVLSAIHAGPPRKDRGSQKWIQLGRCPVYCHGFARPHTPILFTCKMIFLEAFPVTFTVNTFAWMNDEAAKESLGKHFDLIRRVEFQTTFVQSRQIILPASCRMLRVQMILEADTYDRGKPPQRVVVVARSAWAATMEQWRKDGVKEIAMIVWCRNFKGLNPPQPLPQGSGPGWKIDKYPWNLLDGVWTEHPWPYKSKH